MSLSGRTNEGRKKTTFETISPHHCLLTNGIAFALILDITCIIYFLHHFKKIRKTGLKVMSSNLTESQNCVKKIGRWILWSWFYPNSVFDFVFFFFFIFFGAVFNRYYETIVWQCEMWTEHTQYASVQWKMT